MLKVPNAFCIQRQLQLLNLHRPFQARTISSLQRHNEDSSMCKPPHPVFHNPARHNSTFSSLYMKLISLPPVHWLEDCLSHLHDVSCLPWSAVVLGCTAAARFSITGPAHVTAQKVAAKRLLLAKEMQDVILPSLKKATDRQVFINKWTEAKAKKSFDRVAGQLHRDKVVELNCHHAKLYTPFYIQIPVWVFTSIALRNMSIMRASQDRLAEIPVEERFLQFSTEGFGWIPNLTIPDETLILPVMVGVLFASTIYLSSNRHANAAPEKMSKFAKGLTYFLYLLSMMMIPVAAMQPSAVALYWASSGAAGLIINLVIMSPRFRRLVKIPKIPSEPQQPYTVVKENIQRQINKILSKRS